MNKSRRVRLNNVKSVLELFLTKLSESKDVLEEVRNEEQDSFDNMPEGLQDSDKGQQMTDAVDAMDSAIADIEEMVSIAESAISDIDLSTT